MVNQSAMNLLFFLGVLIPALITVALFVVFCFCWYKMRIRNQILYKKYDPHKIEKLKDGEIYEAPPPPPPPFKSDSQFFSETMSHNNNNVNKNKPTDNYEESPEPTEGIDNPSLYRAEPSNGGFSDLNKIQCNIDNPAVQRNDLDACRPNSQASDDSDDSGFRSSRSGQYIHSASSSTGNAQENCHGVSSCQIHDSVPLFKPIKIHPNENGRQPIVSYIHRNSSKHKSFNKHRKPIPSSQHYNSGLESHNNINTISQLQQQQQLQHQIQISQSSHVAQSTAQPCYNIQPFSKSNNDVHGSRLHSIDSHVQPLSSVGHYGLRTSMSDHCGHVHSNGYYSDGHLSQPNSIGYGSDYNSLNGQGPLHSAGYNIGPGQVKSHQLCHIPANQYPVLNNKHPVSAHIPGYNISTSSHMRPIKPELSMHKFSEPLQTVSESPLPLKITQAMVHRPYIEELSDPKLYSVV